MPLSLTFSKGYGVKKVPLNFVVTRKQGKRESFLSYHESLAGALESLYERLVFDETEAETIKGLINHQRRVVSALNSSLQPLKITVHQKTEANSKN